MTTSNCSFDAVHRVMQHLELALYIPIFLCGVVVNVHALYVFCIFLPKWSESTIYMTNLVLMDLMLLFPLPFKMHAANHMWATRHRGFCSFLESLYFVGMYGSIYTITCIAVDRWLAICHPFRAKRYRSHRAALVTCAAVWAGVWVAVLATVYLIYSSRQADDQDFHCFHEFSPKVWRPAVIAGVEVFGYVCPALVVVGCSAQTVRTLGKSGERSAQSRACVRIIYSSMCAFLLPFTPSHLAILLQFLVHREVIQDCGTKTHVSLFLQVALCLANVTCCLDAVCYYFIAKEVRRPKSARRSTTSHGRATHSTSEL